MNDFQYKMAIASIESATLVKDLEVLVRKYLPRISEYTTWSVEDFQKDNILNKVRVYFFALYSFEQKSNRKLPSFIYEARTNLTKALTRHFSKQQTITYAEYIDLFKYVPEIVCFRNAGPIIKTLAEIVKDNENPYKINYNYCSSLFDNYTIGHSDNLRLAVYIARQKLDYEGISTIYESILSDMYSTSEVKGIDITDYIKLSKQKQAMEITMSELGISYDRL